MCHRLPHFIEKAGRAGVARVFIGLESINPDALMGARKKQNKVAEYRKMLLEWKKAGVTVFAGYIIGFPSDTPESVMRDMRRFSASCRSICWPHCLTPLPGSEDHQKLHKAGAYLDPDLNILRAAVLRPTCGGAVAEAVSRCVGGLLFAGAFGDGDAAVRSAPTKRGT